MLLAVAFDVVQSQQVWIVFSTADAHSSVYAKHDLFDTLTSITAVGSPLDLIFGTTVVCQPLPFMLCVIVLVIFLAIRRHTYSLRAGVSTTNALKRGFSLSGLRGHL
jgi:hypothetical protein